VAKAKFKMPKRPKRSASYKTWANWEQRCNAVDKRKREVESEKKKKEQLIKRIENKFRHR
jgi:hypothetical protein